MMNRREAEAYGQEIGCRYFVRTDTGGLLGGFTKRKDAEKCMARFAQEAEEAGVRIYIEDRRA